MKRKPGAAGDIELPEIDLPDIDIDIDFGDDQAEEAERQAKVDYEAQAEAELHELRSDFQKRAKNEEKRFYEAVDSEHWIAICFQSREQKEAFLRAKHWVRHGDKYLSGDDVAKQEGVKIPPAQPPRKTRPISKKLTDLV